MDLNEIIAKLNEDVDLSDEEIDTLENMSDEDEQLDELSKETLKNYISKAGQNIASTAKKAGSNKKAMPSSINNRLTGIDRAAVKLTKRGRYAKTKARMGMSEDVESLDELSRKTLGNYIRKAIHSSGGYDEEAAFVRKLADHDNTLSHSERKNLHNLANKSEKKASQRRTNTVKAFDKFAKKPYIKLTKLTKEDVMEAAIDTLKPGGAPGELKSDLTAKLLAMTPMMSINDLRSTIDGILNQYPEIAKKIPNNSESNRKSVDMKEDVQSLFEGQDLSDEFKTKTTNLFESALAIRVTEELNKYRLELEEAQNSELETIAENVDSILDEIINKLNAYTDYIAEQFIIENEVAIESALKNEINEGFIEGLRNLFAEHYIEVPEERLDVIQVMEDKIADLEKAMDVLIERNNDLEEAIIESEKDSILDEMTEGLSIINASKVKEIAESIDYDNVDDFIEKIEYIKEKVTAKPAIKSNILEESFEGDEVKTQEISEDMARYLQAISRTTVK